MIDTIALDFPKPGTDGWDGWALRTTHRGIPTYSKKADPELTAAAYYPQLLGYRKHTAMNTWRPTIRAIFSAPKLVFGNNLDELREDQYTDVVALLRRRLLDMGIRVTEAVISNAIVSEVHYSKNFLLRGYTAYHAVSEMRKLNVSRRMSLTTKEYPRGGKGLSMYTKKYSIEFYDKVAEIEAENAALLANADPSLEVLRMEVRLKKKKLNTLLHSLGYATDPRFREAFSLAKSRDVIEHYWNHIVLEERDLLVAAPITPKELLRAVLLRLPSIRGNNALLRTSLVMLVRDGQGQQELDDMLRGRVNPRTLANYRKQIAQTARLLATGTGGWLEQVQRQLDRYEQMRVQDLNQIDNRMTI